MTDGEVLQGILRGIGNRADARDVETLFSEEGVYDALGYEGIDVRSEQPIPDDRCPDCITLDATGAVTAVYEFAPTGRDLEPHANRLFDYVDELKADCGVVTDGERFRLYERDRSSPSVTVALSDVSEDRARDLYSALRKPEWDVTAPERVRAFPDGLDSVSLAGELGRAHFLDTFRLEAGSRFADLVTATVGLLRELRDERDAAFASRAYDRWEATSPSDPDEAPDSWEPHVDGSESLADFAFCLESAHALLARLLLAKAADDYGLCPSDEGFRQYLDGGVSGEIDPDAYPVAADRMTEETADHLVESPFEDDVFTWWREAYRAEERLATRERFSRAVARVFLSVLAFDFAAAEGDPLGDLYRRNFDPETRKALGEFYTPQPVVEYIMDGVGYDTGVSDERLIDPSCGSGTFLVEAVERYLADVRRVDADPDWETRLTELCARPHVVGLDVRPFAVLVARIRFLVAVLPEYREAKRENPDFTLRRLPIFRTDALRDDGPTTASHPKDDYDGRPFEYVVGNPPYVRIQRISDAMKRSLDRRYCSTGGAYDLYYLFYERGVELLADDGGRLGYITPSQFMTADDGGALRDFLLTTVKINEVFDFRGAGVFEDALNYPAIVLLEKATRQERRRNDVRTIRVRADFESPPDDLGERVVNAAKAHRTEPGYVDDCVDVFDFPQAELDDGDWTLMPPDEYDVFTKLRTRAETTVEEITEAVFQGVRTGANDVFVVTPLDRDRIEPDAGGDVVTVRPSGSERTHRVESDLLCPWVEKRDFQRWQADWTGRHLLCPYTRGEDVELLAPDVLRDEYPLTWEYLDRHRDELTRRDGGTLEDARDWYRLSRPQNLERFPEPKIVGKEFSNEARFMADDGDWHFASAYGIQLAPEHRSRTDHVVGLLNSGALDFYLKHVASIKSFSPVTAYYAYRTRYIKQLPCPSSGAGDSVRTKVRQIRDGLALENKTNRFPEAYLGDFSGPLEWVDYEWQTRRYPVDAEIRARPDGTYAVGAGRSDRITGPQIDTEERARYVRAAVDGRNVERGEETSVPIPRDDGDVRALLDEWDADREAVGEIDREKLEAEIDRAVSDLFDLTADERDVVEEYLDVF